MSFQNISAEPIERHRSSRMHDPLRRLPPEVAIDVIRDTLPSDETYTSHLVDLTTISTWWQDFLLSTPILWNTLYLDEAQPDFLALLATSIHYSAGLALKIVLWGDSIIDWEGIAQVLLPVHDRVVVLGIRRSRDKSETEEEEEFDPWAISNILYYLQNLPGLMEIEVDERLKLNPAEIEMDGPNFAQPVRFTGRMKADLRNVFREGSNPMAFDRNGPVGYIDLPVQSWQECWISVWMLHKVVEVRVTTSEFLPHLSSIAVNLANSFRLEHALRSVGSHLCNLTAGVALVHIADLVNCLQLLPHLQILDLRINVGDHGLKASPVRIESGFIVRELQELYVTLNDSLELHATLLEPLFEVLSYLYPKVRKVIIKSDTWPSLVHSYIGSISAVQYLYLAAKGQNGDPPNNLPNISLPSLQTLILIHPSSLCPIIAPSLLSLKVQASQLDARLLDLRFSSIVKLGIYSRKSLDFGHLNPMHFPHVREITLETGGVMQIRRLLSFQCIVSINITPSASYTNSEGNNLCVALIYRPEQCPSLQELHFASFLDWDILFLMLERRNFGRKNVQKIRTVSLPYVPFIFRESLSLMLLGESKDRPPLMDASLGAAREVLWDPEIPGCFSCLTNMWPACGSLVGGHLESAQELLELFPDHEHHTGGGLEDIRDRINGHRYWLNDWVAAYTEFRKEHSRYGRCERYHH